MPYIGVTTSQEIPPNKQEVVLKALSSTVATSTGKPEQYVMVSMTHAAMMFGDDTEVAAFVDVRGIGGLTRSVNEDITKRVCSLLEAVLGIPTERIYLTFTDVEATNWGWNNTTFG